MKELVYQIRLTTRCCEVVRLGFLSIGVLLMLHTAVIAQTESTVRSHVPVAVDSGVVGNTARSVATAFSTTVQVPGAVWVRLDFDEVLLAGDIRQGTASYLRMTSVADGAFQVMNATHIAQWENTSAYFNGDAVVVEIIAHPNTGANRLVIKEVTIGVPGEDGGERKICDGTDGRTTTIDKAVGRGWIASGNAKCTAFIIDDCKHCLFTAGHCRDLDLKQIHFNVEPSKADGTPEMSDPKDQYAIDASSWQSNSGGSGNDWAYFGCFPNPNTGLTPYAAQRKFFTLATPPAPSRQEIRVTGYGVTTAPVDPKLNRVLKKGTGNYKSFSGSTVAYRVDTTSGNSGSPVMIDSRPSEAIAIHESGGCGVGGMGANYGTGINNSGLQNALDNPKGVCAVPVPTVSEWGMAAIVLLLLTAITIKFGGRRAVNTPA